MNKHSININYDSSCLLYLLSGSVVFLFNCISVHDSNVSKSVELLVYIVVQLYYFHQIRNGTFHPCGIHELLHHSLIFVLMMLGFSCSFKNNISQVFFRL